MRLQQYLNEITKGINFYGADDGYWIETTEYLLGSLKEWDWEMISGMSSENKGKNYMVEGATETHSGFLKALKEIVAKHKNLKSYLIKFDAPGWQKIEDLLGAGKFDWKKIKFYHGTSEEAWEYATEPIKTYGLRSREKTGAAAAYGGASSAPKGRKDVVYLTTQRSMANFASVDASRATKSKPVVLQIDGRYLDPKYYVPDEDSREQSAKMSLDRMGSVGYKKDIPPKAIKRIK